MAHAVRETYDESYDPDTANSSSKQKNPTAKTTAAAAPVAMPGDAPTADATIAAALREAAVKVPSPWCHS